MLFQALMLVEHRNILIHGRANATIGRYLVVFSHAFTMAVRAWQWGDDDSTPAAVLVVLAAYPLRCL